MSGCTLTWTRRGLLVASVVALVIGTPPVHAAKKKDAPVTVESVLAKVDAALFFHDRQDHLDGYDVELATWSAVEMHGAIEGPRRDEARTLGKLAVSDGGKKRTGSRTVTSYTPSCGSWTLTELMRLEMALLARPWSEVLGAARWKRAARADAGGLVLEVTPKKRASGKMLAPAITKATFTLTADGHPTNAKFALDLEVMQGEATLTFTLADHGEQKRIASIAHVIPSVNVEIHPVVTLTLATKSGLDLPDYLEFRVPAKQLANSLLGKGDSVSYLIYRDYAVHRTDDDESSEDGR